MIVITFEPKYEDRVSLYFKNSPLKQYGVEITFVDKPNSTNLETRKCFWTIKYPHAKLVNPILSQLTELKEIMGIHDLKFSFAYNDAEYYTQTSVFHRDMFSSIQWFHI